MSMLLPRILCVDDEPHVLEGLAAILRRRFNVSTALGGEAALALAEREDPFVVVLSDARMPGIDGATLLKRFRQQSPDTVRLLLTGSTELHSAVSVVNEGQIFRFLTKPCPAEHLVLAIDDAVEHHRLVTDARAKLLHEIEDVSHRLQDAERQSTLGRLAAGIGHEINNVTTVLMGIMEELEGCAEDGVPPDADDLRVLKQLSQHYTLHGHHLLELGRPGPERPMLLDLRDAVRETLALLRSVGKTKSLDTHLELPDAPMLVNVDRRRIEQVIVNLVSNAADAMVDTRRARQLTVVVRRDESGRRVSCSVEDTGCGVSPEVQGRMFEPYFTTKSGRHGNGLGLPVVRQIISAYGGNMSVKSTPDVGSTFTFELPLVDSEDA